MIRRSWKCHRHSPIERWLKKVAINSESNSLSECALTRLPNEKELRMFQELLDRQRTRSRKGRFEAAESERAAWAMVASTLLNLDEAISKQ